MGSSFINLRELRRHGNKRARILLHQPKGTPAPQKQKCSVCRQNCFKLYLVHSKESPAADCAALTASTRCAVEAASLPASQPPTDSPTTKKQDDRHRDRNYIHNRLLRHLWNTLIRFGAFPCVTDATRDLPKTSSQRVKNLRGPSSAISSRHVGHNACHNASSALLRSRFHTIEPNEPAAHVITQYIICPTA